MQTNSSHESEAEESKAVVEDHDSKIQVATEEKQKDAMGETLVCSICQVQKKLWFGKKLIL